MRPDGNSILVVLRADHQVSHPVGRHRRRTRRVRGVFGPDTRDADQAKQRERSGQPHDFEKLEFHDSFDGFAGNLLPNSSEVVRNNFCLAGVCMAWFEECA